MQSTSVDVRRRVQGLLRLNDIHFDQPHPFIFICNSNVRQKGWTPDRLFEKKGLTDFGSMKRVVVQITTFNFNHALMLVECWLEAGMKVTIEFPILTSRPRFRGKNNPRFKGMDIESCYRPTSSGGWTPADTFRQFVRDVFAGDRSVQVSRAD